jgi:hypothetical protein
MNTTADLKLLAPYLVSLGDDFPQLSFALNNPGAPNTVYVGADPTANAGVQFQITTSTDTTLTPGAPVPVGQAPNVSYSLLYLDLTPFNLSDAAFTNIALASNSGWAALPDLATRTICLAPQGQPIALAAGTAGVSVALTGFALANPPSGSTAQLNATYYNVDGITIGNFPSFTPLEVALLRPPDQNDNDLHDDIALTVQPTLMVCSKDPYAPVANTLTIQFSPGPQGRQVTAGNQTVFEVHFLYAETPGFGALCTAAQGAKFTPARGTNAQQWDQSLVIGTQEPYVSLKPPADAAILGSGVGAVVTFDIGNIITNLQPGPTQMLVTYSGIPNYQDGSFQFVLTKVPHVDIVSFEVTPNPAQLENKDGVAVVIDWVTHDAGALRLTSSGGLDQDVTGTLSFPTTIKQTTDFHLDADGIYGANLDNKATKPTTAVVTPHIEFSATILSDGTGLQLVWNVVGANSVEIDGNPNLLDLQGQMPIPVSSSNPPPYSFALKALDADRNVIGRATLKRRWVAGGSVPVGGNTLSGAMPGIVLSPDGTRLYAAAGDWNTASLSLFEVATLRPLGSIPANLHHLAAIACAPDSSKIYAVTGAATEGTASLTVFDANCHTVIETIRLGDLANGFNSPAGLVANDNYIFIKARYGPVSLLVIDAKKYTAALTELVPYNPNFPLPISSGLALTRQKAYYTGNNVVKTLDSETLALLNTANVALSDTDVLLLAAPDDSRTFLADEDPAQAWTFQGSDWLNPTIMPVPNVYLRDGIAVTSDCMQVFLLCFGGDSFIQIDEFDFGSASYVSGARLLQGAGRPCAIAITPDNTRVFVGLVDADENNAFISVLDASYERSDS